MDYDFRSLKEKKVLVTGGSGAIGQAIAKGFVSVGAQVILWAHRDIDELIKKDCLEFAIVELENKSAIEQAFFELMNKIKHVDILVNCAGYTTGNRSEDYSYNDWMKTLSINLTAPFLLSQLVAGKMISEKLQGSIINITSIGAEFGFPENPAYVASKGGLKQLTKGLAYDWAKYGIRVNNVGPGYTQTKMTIGSWNDEELRNQRSEQTMLKRWAKPEELVGTVLFLASSMAVYITGQDIYVDGGWTAKGL